MWRSKPARGERARAIRTPRRLAPRANYLLTMSIGLVIAASLFGWAVSSGCRSLLRAEFQAHGETLVRGLAAVGRSDVRAGDKDRLGRLANSVCEDADVVAASVYGPAHELLARTEKVAGAATEHPSPPRGSVAVEAKTLPDGRGALSFLAPVEAVEVESAGRSVESAERRDRDGDRPVSSEGLGAVEVVFSLGAVERRIAGMQATAIGAAAAIGAFGVVMSFWLSRTFVRSIARPPSVALAQGDREPPSAKLLSGQKFRGRVAEDFSADADLERRSRSESEVFAGLSHELRTPLHAINGFAELLLEQGSGPLVPKQKVYVENILACGKHLLQLVNDSLDLRKIEAGRMDVRLGDFSLSEAIEGVARAMRPLAEKKGLAIDVKIAPGLDRVRLDEGKTRQVLFNLTSNAVKFTDTGKVTISAAGNVPAAGWVEIAIHDTGTGIRAEDQERIFREFEQVEGAPSAELAGTGLGLALARRLVELQGGTISVESGIGRGSRFVVRLPSRIATGTPPEEGKET
jgi:signal transduction histidine kinase